MRFSRPTTDLKQTEKFISYMEDLLTQNVISLRGIETLVRGLEAGEILNPIAKAATYSNSSKNTHYYGLQEYLDGKSSLHKNQILQWARRKLEKENKEKREKKTVRDRAQAIYDTMSFVIIEAGHFYMGSQQQKVGVDITEPFAIQSTPVTQYQWVLIMGNNPSFFKYKTGHKLKVEGKIVHLQPDHPVENVTLSEVRAYIDRLNNLSKKDDPLIYKVIPFHKKGDQYRLPTGAEWEYVARDRGKEEGYFSFGNEVSLLDDFAWYTRNSKGHTHEVAKRKPLMIDGKTPIWDIHGNVHEMVDGWGKVEHPYWRDSSSSFKETNHVSRGGSFNQGSTYTSFEKYYTFKAGEKSNEIGFRLVRILK